MSFLRGLLWFLGAIALIAVAISVAGSYDVNDRFTGLFLDIQPYLPLELQFDQFLVALTVLSLIVVVIIFLGCGALLLLMGARLSVAKQKEAAQGVAAKKEVAHITEQHQRQYTQLVSMGGTLAKRLDKRVLLQGIVEAAGKIASVPQANAIASCWIFQLDTETIRFDTGLYCDETFFAKAECLPTEQPFAQAIASKKPLIAPDYKTQFPWVKPDKARALGGATALILVPFVIEESVLGFLVLFCHPDVVKSYPTLEGFYNACWAELGLGLAIAIQGEVAILDRLTGVHNREYFKKRLIQEIDRANRFKVPLALLMVDIDNFKAVNDALGHPQGDAVLRIISKLIKKEIRAIDLAGRYGGEEFIILLPETGQGDPGSAAAGPLIVAERIRKAVDDEFRGMMKPLSLTVSIGVAVRRFPDEKHWDYQELIRLADEQLYKAKTTGKNKVCVYQPPAPATAAS